MSLSLSEVIHLGGCAIIRNDPNYYKKLPFYTVASFAYVLALIFFVLPRSLLLFGVGFVCLFILPTLVSAWRPHPNFIPYQPPMYFKTRFEEKFWPPFSLLSFIAMPIGFLSAQATGNDLFYIGSGAGLIGHFSGILFHAYSQSIRLDRVNDDLAGRKSSLPLRVVFNLLMIAGAIGGTILAFMLGDPEPGFWMLIPAGWVFLIGSLYCGYQIWRFEPESPPLYLRDRETFMGIVLWQTLGFSIFVVGLIDLSLGNNWGFGFAFLGAIFAAIGGAPLAYYRWRGERQTAKMVRERE
ncbi:MAG: hypothetical protein EP347_00105 [Alphaproteobacteria bacterium]|nr:MAG: hypothetical protein EP347_00105 [Alphaproteobacteria bacterium]